MLHGQLHSCALKLFCPSFKVYTNPVDVMDNLCGYPGDDTDRLNSRQCPVMTCMLWAAC